MRHRNFLVGIVVGAMLAGTGFIVSTVDARPRRPGSRPPPGAPQKKVPGPKKKEARDPIPVVYECPDSVNMARRPLVQLPSGWSEVRQTNILLPFSGAQVAVVFPEASAVKIWCYYRTEEANVKRIIEKYVPGKDCEGGGSGNRKITCYR